MVIYIKIITFILIAGAPAHLQGSFFSTIFGYGTPSTAEVRTDNGLCVPELNTFKNRLDKCQNPLSKFVGKNLTNATMPYIGLVCSGGGFRSAIAALGLWRGLEKIALLDGVAYNATLSGSTWSSAAWYAHAMNLDELTTYLKVKMNDATNPKKLDLEAIIERLIQKVESGRHFSFNDIYGAFLADVFFRTETQSGQDVFLTDIQPLITEAILPIPLFSAAIGNTEPAYQWTEFSPFETGSTYLNAWIPSSTIGKKFSNGVSYDKKPAEHFGYLLGAFGSAYAVSLVDYLTIIVDELKQKHPSLVLAEETFSLLPFENEFRFSPAKINNFGHKLSSSPLGDLSELTLIDAGIHINMPFIPLFRRGMNVYIVCDASGDTTFAKGEVMQLVAAYAQKNSIPFPPINFDELGNHPVSIWYDVNNPACPVVIYIPNFQEFSTFKFSYSEEEFDRLMSGIENAVINNVDVIKKGINIAVANLEKNRN